MSYEADNKNRVPELLYLKVGIAVAVRELETGEIIAATLVAIGQEKEGLPEIPGREVIESLFDSARKQMLEMFSDGSVEIIPLSRQEYVKWLAENQSEESEE